MTESERLDSKKAMAFDLQLIFESCGKEQLTLQEIRELLVAYIKGAEQ